MLVKMSNIKNFLLNLIKADCNIIYIKEMLGKNQFAHI